MDEPTFHRYLLWGFLAVAALTLPLLFFVTAPYGRHEVRSWGPTIDNRLGWIVMELPSVLVFFACWYLGGCPTDPARLAFLSLWQLHYVHRAFVFPFRLRSGTKRMPVVIAGFGFTFTSINAYLNGRWLFSFAGDARYGEAWLSDPRFWCGAVIFLVGFAVNQHADWVLLHLRKPGETGYKIPKGGLYRWVTCPNYLGEILEWAGFALCTYSLPALAFAVWTVANLLPRARSHHRWYLDKFEDYPCERKALLPGLF
jgi:3-oxo-5-alpha-steroid 4-dehydrogenase 1